MPKTAPAPASFESALAELESIVASMEGGQLPLKEALDAGLPGDLLLDHPEVLAAVERMNAIPETTQAPGYGTPKYQAAATHVVSTDGVSTADVAERVLQLIPREPSH